MEIIKYIVMVIFGIMIGSFTILTIKERKEIDEIIDEGLYSSNIANKFKKQ